MATDVYQILKDRMDKQRLSFPTLAKEIGLSKDGLHKAFRSKSLKLETMIRICEVLGMQPWEIWEDEMEEARLISESTHLYGHAATVQDKLKIIAKLTKELQQELTK